MSKKNLKEVKIEQKAFDLIEKRASETGKTVDEVANEMVEKMDVPKIKANKPIEFRYMLPISEVINTIRHANTVIDFNIMLKEFTFEGVKFELAGSNHLDSFEIIVRPNEVFKYNGVNLSGFVFRFTYNYSADRTKANKDCVSWIYTIIESKRLNEARLSTNYLETIITTSKELKDSGFVISSFYLNPLDFENNRIAILDTLTNKTTRLTVYFEADSTDTIVVCDREEYIGTSWIGDDSDVCGCLCNHLKGLRK